MPKSEAGKEHILDVAAQLFYKNGYRATGVDAIANAAGIKKATLYHHFTNKDNIIELALSRLSRIHRQEYQDLWDKHKGKPLKQLLVMFVEINHFFNDPDCYGCPYMNAAAEYTDRNHPVRKICEAHYRFVTQKFEQFAREAGLAQPKLLAEKLVTLIVGTFASWYVVGNEVAAKQGRSLAELLIEKHTENQK